MYLFLAGILPEPVHVGLHVVLSHISEGQDGSDQRLLQQFQVIFAHSSFNLQQCFSNCQHTRCSPTTSHCKFLKLNNRINPECDTLTPEKVSSSYACMLSTIVSNQSVKCIWCCRCCTTITVLLCLCQKNRPQKPVLPNIR